MYLFTGFFLWENFSCIGLEAFTYESFILITFNLIWDGYSASKGVGYMYKKQEKWLIVLSFFVAAIMLLSIAGRIFGS